MACRRTLWSPLLAAALVVNACQSPETPVIKGDEVVERVVVAMGTGLRLRVSAASRQGALQASEAAVRAIEAVSSRLSTWRSDSELSRLNTAPAGVSVDLSGELLTDLRKARRWSKATGGAFDPGVGAFAFQGFNQTGFFTTDVGACSTSQFNMWEFARRVGL